MRKSYTVTYLSGKRRRIEINLECGRLPVIAIMTKADLALVIEAFPDRAHVIRRLFLADSGFQELCADYVLACETLQGFERRPDAAARPEIAEYRHIIGELAREIAQRLQRIGPAARGGGMG